MPLLYSSLVRNFVITAIIGVHRSKMYQGESNRVCVYRGFQTLRIWLSGNQVPPFSGTRVRNADRVIQSWFAFIEV